MNDVYEEVKSRGWKKNDPNHSKEWRKKWNADRKKRSHRIRRHCRVKVSRDLMKLSQNEDHKTPKADDVMWNRDTPYHKEYLFPYKTLKQWKVMRTNMFCKVKNCGYKFCEHRNNFGAAIFIALWKRRSPILKDFPKDIIFYMSKMILNAHVDFLTEIGVYDDYDDHFTFYMF